MPMFWLRLLRSSFRGKTISKVSSLRWRGSICLVTKFEYYCDEVELYYCEEVALYYCDEVGFHFYDLYHIIVTYSGFNLSPPDRTSSISSVSLSINSTWGGGVVFSKVWNFNFSYSYSFYLSHFSHPEPQIAQIRVLPPSTPPPFPCHLLPNQAVVGPTQAREPPHVLRPRYPQRLVQLRGYKQKRIFCYQNASPAFYSLFGVKFDDFDLRI